MTLHQQTTILAEVPLISSSTAIHYTLSACPPMQAKGPMGFGALMHCFPFHSHFMSLQPEATEWKAWEYVERVMGRRMVRRHGDKTKR